MGSSHGLPSIESLRASAAAARKNEALFPISGSAYKISGPKFGLHSSGASQTKARITYRQAGPQQNCTSSCISPCFVRHRTSSSARPCRVVPAHVLASVRPEVTVFVDLVPLRVRRAATGQAQGGATWCPASSALPVELMPCELCSTSSVVAILALSFLCPASSASSASALLGFLLPHHCHGSSTFLLALLSFFEA
jgi:hypothetical protein